MAPVLGGVLTASEACPGATLLRPGTAGPAPARAEDIAPAVADPLPTESSIGASPGGQGPWKPGEGGVGSWVPWPATISPLSSSPPSAPHLVLGASPVGAAAWRGLPSQGAAQQIWARGNPGAAWIPCSQAPAPQDVPQCPPLHALEEGAIGGGRGVPGSHLTRGWGCWKGAELGTTRLAAH